MTTMINNDEDRLPIIRSVQARGDDDALLLPQPITDYTAVHAWVLLGNPGAGKTDAFKSLSDAEGGQYTSARDFVAPVQTTTNDAPIFIDGLDEISAGYANGSTAIDQIRGRLQALGKPKFRISCREADWRGNTDSEALKRLVGTQDFAELHLMPLSRQESEALVRHWQAADAPAAAAADFIAQAKRQNLDDLLDNPQTLKMLVKATAKGWPASKTQTYKMACDELVKEPNEQHLANNIYSALPHASLLQAASYLYALMLLSGRAGVAFQKTNNTADGIFALNEISELADNEAAPDIAHCRAALRTRLFAAPGNGEFLPAHRTVAEYLAAQYIARRINEGLPYRRVLALMLGQDGGLVPEMRGLHAWLAAVAVGPLREQLIDRDPLGVVLYGDVREFTHQEKLQVLSGLSREATHYARFRRQNWRAEPFGALATLEMEGDFRRLLTSNDRIPAHLALVDCVLDAIANGHALHALKPELERVVRDRTYWPRSRATALQALIAFERPAGEWRACRQLLADIHRGAVQDSEDDLLGTLLFALYPRHIAAADLWPFLKNTKSAFQLGSYSFFWHSFAKNTASSHDVTQLLDAMVANGFELSGHYDAAGSAEIVGELLVRAICELGAQATAPQLYGWLALGWAPHHQLVLRAEHKKAIANWLSSNPARYKALFEFGLKQAEKNAKSESLNLSAINLQLYGAEEPVDAGPWYLSLAEVNPVQYSRLTLAARALSRITDAHGPNAAIEMLQTWRANHPADDAWVDSQLQSTYPPTEAERVFIDENKAGTEHQHENEQQQKLAFFEKNLPGFRDNVFHLGALVEIAETYLGFPPNSDDEHAQTRLLALLNQNQDWLELALHGLRQCLLRTDLPRASEIVDEKLRFNWALPCLAAAALRWTELGPGAALELPEPVLEMLVAFRLVNNYGNLPAWFEHLMHTQAALVARIMGDHITAQIAHKKEHVEGLYALAHSAKYSPDSSSSSSSSDSSNGRSDSSPGRPSHYASVASLVVPAIAKAFPRKAHSAQLRALRLVIVAVMARLERSQQLDIIAGKLCDKPGDVAQRVYWLTAGLQLAPDLYLEPAKQYIAHTQSRTSHLIALVQEQRDRNQRQPDLPLKALEFLIELLGAQSAPSPVMTGPSGLYGVTPATELARYVEGLISSVSALPDEVAGQMLASFVQNKHLQQWDDYLRAAQCDQQLVRRKALFSPEPLLVVSSTLANRAPANAADLWALTLGHLTQLSGEIRNGNTNDYEDYWVDKETPRNEDFCRNRLLSALKIRLNPFGISAEQEGRYADAKRSDIKVLARGYNIPVEIKLEKSTDLWTAIQKQLISRYTREAATDKYGIYLVFWFGGKFQRAVAEDGGTKPKTAAELQARLQKTVPASHAKKIAVLVIDCELKPTGKAAAESASGGIEIIQE